MFRICCLKKGETAQTLSKEVLYYRYLRFYFIFHVIYTIVTLVENIVFIGEDWDSFYFASFICLLIDCGLILGLLLRPEKGPDKRVIGIAFVMTCLTLILYIVSRVYSCADPDSSGLYKALVILLLLFFVFTKTRCTYHIYRFNRFNSFEKLTTNLAVKSPIGIDDNSWSHNDGFEVGAGETKYVTLRDNKDKDTLGALPTLSSSYQNDRLDSIGSSRDGSLDLGNVSVVLDHHKSESQHSFHAVSGSGRGSMDSVDINSSLNSAKGYIEP